jgi:hypothetical protein
MHPDERNALVEGLLLEHEAKRWVAQRPSVEAVSLRGR